MVLGKIDKLTDKYLKGFDYKFSYSLEIPHSFVLIVYFTSYKKFSSFLKTKFYDFCSQLEEDLYYLRYIYFPFYRSGVKRMTFLFEGIKDLVMKDFLVKYFTDFSFLVPFKVKDIEIENIGFHYSFTILSSWRPLRLITWKFHIDQDPLQILISLILTLIASERRDGSLEFFNTDKIKELAKLFRDKDMKEIYTMLRLFYDDIKSYGVKF